ncbi:MAG: sugar-binding transcriptional regulator [Fusobacteriales bacterium]|jgi:DNA-binding transcriptional regulator LsrR (DeoR family)|nr:sugar-binding transcriptional regulator [Fusobacteriales bacterium]
MVENKLLSTICKMYYYDELTQNQIADILKIERTKISRLIKKAKKTGIVKIVISETFLEQLEIETKLKKKYGLKEVQLVSTDENTLASIAETAHTYIQRAAQEKETVGITWGKTIHEFSIYKSLDVSCRIDFIPLLGGYGNLRDYMSINSMIYTLSSSYNGEPYFLESPLVVDNSEMKRQIVNSRYFQNIIKKWSELRITVVGIGSLEKSSNIFWELGLPELRGVGSIQKEIKKQKAVGEICSRIYNINGEIIKTKLDDRIIGIDLPELKKIEYSVGIASGKEKTEAIYGALKGKFINVLITDIETGKKLLEKE